MPAKGKPSNNPKGRPPDSKVKAYRDAVREKQFSLINTMYDMLATLDGKEWLEYYLKINRDILPPLVSELNEEEITQSVVSVFETIHKTLQEDINKKSTVTKKVVGLKKTA